MQRKLKRNFVIRNGINYYGKDISVEEVKENVSEIIKLIETLKKKYLEQQLSITDLKSESDNN